MQQFTAIAMYNLNNQSLALVCDQKKTSYLFRCAIKELF